MTLLSSAPMNSTGTPGMSRYPYFLTLNVTRHFVSGLWNPLPPFAFPMARGMDSLLSASSLESHCTTSPSPSPSASPSTWTTLNMFPPRGRMTGIQRAVFSSIPVCSRNSSSGRYSRVSRAKSGTFASPSIIHRLYMLKERMAVFVMVVVWPSSLYSTS